LNAELRTEENQKDLKSYRPISNTEREKRHSILIVDDDPVCLKIYAGAIGSNDILIRSASTLKEALELIAFEKFTIILLDIHLPDVSDLSGIDAIKKVAPASTLIVFTVDDDINQAIRFMNFGASDFLLKKHDILSNVAKIKQYLPHKLALAPLTKSRLLEHGIICGSSKMIRVLKNIEILENVSSPVLIFGESGTGKEKIAHYVHKTSSRSEGPFIALNCAAIAPNLFESELFGHKKGAFTDAKADKKGFFELCNNGTLFLDEIGELPLELQAKLLRVVERQEVIPVGSCTPVKINTRIVSATNKDLSPTLNQGSFRKDLYYRLSVFKFSIPPLRERLEDLEALTNHFLKDFSQKFKQFRDFSFVNEKVKLFNYSWPGNIRELKNFIERIVALSTNDIGYVDELMREMTAECLPTTEATLISENLMVHEFDEAEKLFRKEYIKFHMNKSNDNISEVSRTVNKSRMWVYRMNAKN